MSERVRRAARVRPGSTGTCHCNLAERTDAEMSERPEVGRSRFLPSQRGDMTGGLASKLPVGGHLQYRPKLLKAYGAIAKKLLNLNQIQLMREVQNSLLEQAGRSCPALVLPPEGLPPAANQDRPEVPAVEGCIRPPSVDRARFLSTQGPPFARPALPPRASESDAALLHVSAHCSVRGC